MRRRCPYRRPAAFTLLLIGSIVARSAGQSAPPPLADRPLLPSRPSAAPPVATPPEAEAAEVTEAALPINLPTALQLAGVRPLDIATATAQLEQAIGLLIQAKALKLPNANGGVGYYRHDGLNQNLFNGSTFFQSTNALQVGGGPTLSVGVTDAIFAPLAARRVVASRRADVQSSRNDSLNNVAQQYFALQEARGRLVGADATIERSIRLVTFAEKLAPSLIAPLEINRSRAELESLRVYRETTLRDWRLASARLAEILLLEPTVLLEPIEPPYLQVALIPREPSVEDLVRISINNRPEIASRRELVAAADQLLRREKARPLLPNLVATSPGTANAGVLSAGQFYGGPNNKLTGHGSRDDYTVSAYWQLQGLGVGNLGLIRQRRGEQQTAAIDLTRVVYRVRSEVAQARARLITARARVPRSEEGLRQAIESADKNFIGLRETTRPAGELLNLIVRPQEVVAALQQLNLAFQDYSSAVNDFNRAQFELYRALGQPAQWVSSLRRPVPPIASPDAPEIPPPPSVSPPANRGGIGNDRAPAP